MFIEPDEHVIIMEDDYFKLLDKNDLGLLKEAGIKSVYLPRAIEYKNGVLDVNQFYARTKNYVDDFKMIVPFYYGNPNKGLKAAFDECMKLRHPNMQLVYAIPDGGEFLWDAILIKDFPKSDEQIISEILEVQELLVEQFGEIWIHFHNFLGDLRNWNNTHLDTVYKAIRDVYPDNPFYSVQFAHFAVANNPTEETSQVKIREYTDKYDMRFFVGSEYCEGLTTNIDKAISQKAYGFITSPIHSQRKINGKSVEPWMVDSIKEANRRFNGRNSLEP